LTTTTTFDGLGSLRGLRSAPCLDPEQGKLLREELAPLLAACEWFTVGVMAASPSAALTALRSLEAAMGWPPLHLAKDDVHGSVAVAVTPDPGDLASADGPVFLKGNQRNGIYRLRGENGLGEGILITGHHASDPGCEDTWGPLPLDLFL
jgi:hypothetical protein